MSSYATSCVQTLDYLLRKHDKMLQEALKMPDTLKSVDTRDKGSSTPLTVEEHDKILELCRTTDLSSVAIARMVGRSSTVVAYVRRGKHKLSPKN